MKAGQFTNEQIVADTPSYSHPRPYVLGIGRLVPQKGFDVLIPAFAESGITTHDLVIAGDGPERAALERAARESGVGERVHFVGRADRPQAVALFKGASFVALPSRADEGLPVVSVETMAAGKAIVASRVGGVPESVLDGETGLIVPREDRAALSAALKRLACDDGLRQRMERAAKRRAPLFAWESIAEQYLRVYHDAVQAGTKRT